MNAVEKLQAAIDKLEDYRDDATRGEWVYDAEIGGEIHAVDESHTGGSAYIGKPDFHDAWLIVTLHRTIDAQLAILREAIRQGSDQWLFVFPFSAYDRIAVALADAILGEE